ncbi:MAG: tetratricopeptide repeat protein [Chromatiales bacterium]|nr:MAG: tetratricopeptide repeat protein [Chromatiales bacterium]
MLLAMIVGGWGMVLPANAQEGEGQKQQQETKRTGSMSEKTYKKLAEAQELADAEDYRGARRVLDDLAASPKLSPYEMAQLYNFYGFIYYAEENYQQSIKSYEKVLAQPEIPQGLHDQTLYTLAQLYFTTENWQKAIDLVNQWLANAQNPGPEPYILLGSGYYSLERWQDMIQPIETAMRIARERDTKVKEQWYLLLRAAYYEMENFQKVKDLLEILVVNWPKKEYWTQLSAMYGELKSERKQLAAYESAYDQNLLVRSSELVQLAQLFLQSQVPYKAARVLEKGFEAGTIEKTADNYRLLANSLQLAAEDRKAIPALKTAAGMAKDGQLFVRLANSYLNISDYDACIESAQKGLDKGGLRRQDNAYIVLGMCLYEKDRYEQAKKAFRSAARDKRSAKTANQWIQFIEREQERERQLERSLQRVRSASTS